MNPQEHASKFLIFIFGYILFTAETCMIVCQISGYGSGASSPID